MLSLIIAAAVLVAFGPASTAQDVDADDWAGIDSWSGSINVAVTEGGSFGGGPLRGELKASARGVVTLELESVRDGPRRLIFVGNDVTFATTYESEAEMPGGTFSSAGSGNSPGGSVELLINLDEGTYKISLEDVGEGITGTGTVVIGGMRQTSSEQFWVDEAEREAADLTLPRNAGALIGTYDLARDFAPMTAGRSGLMSWSLTPCTSGSEVELAIEPFQWDMLVFNEEEEPTLVEEAYWQKLSPESAESQIQWTFPSIDGVMMTTDPTDARGSPVTVTYESMPVENEAFDVDEPLRARVGGCGSTANDEMPARFFFDRDNTGNPDEKEVPNWFYYWLQTSAGQSLSRDQIRYSSFCLGKNDTFGFYGPPGAAFIFVCDPATTSSWNVVTGKFTSGIDSYAATVLHELAHKKHYEDWWQAFDNAWTVRHGTSRFDERPCERKDCLRPEYVDSWLELDGDWDDIPDSIEESLGMETDNPETNDCKMTDEHYLAWLAEDQWAIGSADEEDWAAPGKQFGYEADADDDYEYEPCGAGSP